MNKQDIQTVLDALTDADRYLSEAGYAVRRDIDAAIDIMQALAEPSEPVAWRYHAVSAWKDADGMCEVSDRWTLIDAPNQRDAHSACCGMEAEPLFTHPAPSKSEPSESATPEDMDKAAYDLAPWLSAALDDPKVCEEYKADINAWFNAAMPSALAEPLHELRDDEIVMLYAGQPQCDADMVEFAREVLAAAREKVNG